jgi:hypothetical protein
MDLHQTTSPGADPNKAHAHDESPREAAALEQGENAQSPSTSGSSTPVPDRDIEKIAANSAPDHCTCGFQPKSDLVEFDGPDDPGNPKNWSKRKRWAITASMGAMTFTVTFSSSIFSVAIPQVAEEYGVSYVVATLGVALFLLVSKLRHGGSLR